MLVAQAWSPHPQNRITADHVQFYFTIPKAMVSNKSKYADTRLKLIIIKDKGIIPISS